MSMAVLHVIQQLSSGGASQALEALVAAARQSRHQVVSLIPATPTARRRLAAHNVCLIEQPTAAALDALINQADVLQIHFWNTPELYDFLTTRQRTRVVIWSHVNGTTAPHILIPELWSYADAIVATGRAFRQPPASNAISTRIPPRSPLGIAMEGITPKHTKQTCVVGLFGTLSYSRMAAEAFDVAAMSLLPGTRLRVVGRGDLLPHWQRRASALQLQEQVEFRGFADSVGVELAQMNVLLHMPKPEGYATADLALQEALLAGVVPVVLAGTSVADLVSHQHTGLVAQNAAECVQHLQALIRDPERRARMSRAGRCRAQRLFSAARCAEDFEQLYQQLCAAPRQQRQLDLGGACSGSERWMASLGAEATPFRISAARAPGWRDADALIAASAPELVGAGAGGILHYRGFFPSDPLLRYWAGLVLATAGRRALAAAELAAAAQSGLEGAQDQLDRLLR